MMTIQQNKKKTLKVLVTGANGFVGTHMCKLLLSKGYDVFAFIRNSSDLSTFKLIVNDWKKIHFFYGDLRVYDSIIPAVKQMTYIFHIAGTIKGSTLKEFKDGNYHGTCNILKACNQHNPSVKRIIVTSSMVAGGPGTIETPQCEDIPSKPLEHDYYGMSKYLTECISKEIMKTLPIVIVRPPTVIGPGDKVSLDLFRIAKMGMKLFVSGKPRPFSIVHVEDLVDGIFLCSQIDHACGETFNFASHGTIPYRDLHEVIGSIVFNRRYGSLIPISIPPKIFYAIGTIMEAISRLMGTPPFINRSKAIQASAPGQTMQTLKAQKLLIWKPKYSITSAVKETGDWYRAHKWI